MKKIALCALLLNSVMAYAMDENPLILFSNNPDAFEIIDMKRGEPSGFDSDLKPIKVIAGNIKHTNVSGPFPIAYHFQWQLSERHPDIAHAKKPVEIEKKKLSEIMLECVIPSEKVFESEIFNGPLYITLKDHSSHEKHLVLIEEPNLIKSITRESTDTSHVGTADKNDLTCFAAHPIEYQLLDVLTSLSEEHATLPRTDVVIGAKNHITMTNDPRFSEAHDLRLQLASQVSEDIKSMQHEDMKRCIFLGNTDTVQNWTDIYTKPYFYMIVQHLNNPDDIQVIFVKRKVEMSDFGKACFFSIEGIKASPESLASNQNKAPRLPRTDAIIALINRNKGTPEQQPTEITKTPDLSDYTTNSYNLIVAEDELSPDYSKLPKTKVVIAGMTEEECADGSYVYHLKLKLLSEVPENTTTIMSTDPGFLECLFSSEERWSFQLACNRSKKKSFNLIVENKNNPGDKRVISIERSINLDYNTPQQQTSFGTSTPSNQKDQTITELFKERNKQSFENQRWHKFYMIGAVTGGLAMVVAVLFALYKMDYVPTINISQFLSNMQVKLLQTIGLSRVG